MSAVTRRPESLGDHAQMYAMGEHLEVFPLRRDKTPYVSQHNATTDPNIVARWWREWPEALIGHRLAAETIILDVDPRHGGDVTWKALGAAFEIPETRTHLSGRGDGGGHTWWVRPTGHLDVKPLNEWARERGIGEDVGGGRWSAGIDILQRDHRYTILPPSPHPDTGAPYRWLRGPECGLAVLPEALAGLLITTAPVRALPVDLGALRYGDSIVEWFNVAHTWADVLPFGWTLVGGGGDEDGSEWRHPGASSPVSATVTDEHLYVYSPNTPFEPTAPGDPHGYSRFAAWALLEHGSDFSAAARAALALRPAPGNVGASPGAVALEPDALAPQASLDDPEIMPGWWPVPLEDVIAGRLEQPIPSVLTIDDADGALFYAGKVNAIYGDSGTGKTWLALAAIAQEIRRGRRAVLVDYEATGAETVARLRLLGLSDEQLSAPTFLYYNPSGSRSALNLAPMLEGLDGDTGVVVIDSVGEAFGEEGIDENVDLEVGAWMRDYPRALADRGPAVVWIDHLTKAAENPWHPSGSKRKKASVTGAIYRVETNAPPTKDRDGVLVISCAKDRHGTYAAKATVAVAAISHRFTGGLSVTLYRPPDEPPEGVAAANLDHLIEAAIGLLEAEGTPLTGRAIVGNIKGRDESIRGALELAVSRGTLVEHSGERGARLYDIPPRPTASDRVRDAAETTASHPPFPFRGMGTPSDALDALKEPPRSDAVERAEEDS